MGCPIMIKRKMFIEYACPVGDSNTNPVLRKKFLGKPKHVITYHFYVAEEIREIMAKMGIKKFSELDR